MTPMIDVVFELIIFFVVTLTQSAIKDETIELEDGQYGTELTPDEVPKNHMQIDVAAVNKDGKAMPRISMFDIPMSVARLREEIRHRKSKIGPNDTISIFIRADYATPHEVIKQVLGACTEEDIWQISIMAVKHDETKGATRPRLKGGKR